MEFPIINHESWIDRISRLCEIVNNKFGVSFSLCKKFNELFMVYYSGAMNIQQATKKILLPDQLFWKEWPWRHKI